MLTIFTVPKAFKGNINIIQRNAILSWKYLVPRPRIVLMGSEVGIKNFSQEINEHYIPKLKTNDKGTPILSDVWSKIKAFPEIEDYVYINSDIILTNSFMETYSLIKKQSERFLIIGKRYELLISRLIRYNKNWENQIKRDVEKKGNQGREGWIDYFIFSKNIHFDMPDFALGRTFWDKWIVWKTIKSNIPVFDASYDILAIHQSHTYNHTTGTKGLWLGVEARQNIILAGGWSHGATINNAHYIIRKKQIIKKSLIIFYMGIFLNQLRIFFNVPSISKIVLYLRARRVVNKLGM